MKLVVTDLDGTLLRSDKSVSDRSIEAIRKLGSQNISFAIATARARRSICVLLPYELQSVYAICCNGAEIYNGDELIYSKYIEADVVKEIVYWLMGSYPEINISSEINNHLFTSFDIEMMKGWIPPYTQVDFKNFEYKPAAKILVDLRGIDNVSDIGRRLPDDLKIVITDGGILGQISHKDVSKINGIKKLAEIFHIELEEIAAFGDDFNDVEMLRECGTGVAMANAPDEIKEISDVVTVSNDDDGVAMQIEKMLFNIG